MDQVKIGRFIAGLRKEKGMTQAQLAERFGISDRAVSKWETGKSLPDASIMLELCDTLGITVNELLKGEAVMMNDYVKIAEENLLEMRRREEDTARKMLTLELVIGFISVFCLLSLMFCAKYLDMQSWLRTLLIVCGFVQFMIAMYFGLKIETEAGYYECPNCGERYVPEFKSVFLAQHINRTRKMTCPHCGKKGWHKKVISRNEDTQM